MQVVDTPKIVVVIGPLKTMLLPALRIVTAFAVLLMPAIIRAAEQISDSFFMYCLLLLTIIEQK
ncbi:hypothetical protein CV103_06190 [Sphingomonas fennica]|uniref:Uncharacterized protein n=1 Tax=Edaphosphingomonas fennica TaxID=114404 RepID=A0A2T4I5B8_9SPHN|nr:hypothetical protein CV103_06190 [Sphingomonas fennica]